MLWMHTIINIIFDLIVYNIATTTLVCWTDLGNVCVLVPHGLSKQGSDIDTNGYIGCYHVSAMYRSTYKQIAPVDNTVIP